MKKSKLASLVLQLMDDDFSYKEAINAVRLTNKGINISKLEKELNKFI